MKKVNVGSTVFFRVRNKALSGTVVAKSAVWDSAKYVVTYHVDVRRSGFEALYVVTPSELLSQKEAVAIELMGEYA